jgi:hypothetical protein
MYSYSNLLSKSKIDIRVKDHAYTGTVRIRVPESTHHAPRRRATGESGNRGNGQQHHSPGTDTQAPTEKPGRFPRQPSHAVVGLLSRVTGGGQVAGQYVSRSTPVRNDSTPAATIWVESRPPPSATQGTLI